MIERRWQTIILEDIANNNNGRQGKYFKNKRNKLLYIFFLFLKKKEN